MADLQGGENATTAAPTNDPNMSTLTDDQESLMSILGAISGSLSILGSSIIVYRVYKNRKNTSPYDRIMLGLSLCDIVSSFAFGLGPSLLPSETSTRSWAKGNVTTCNFLGFLTQFSFCAVWYNGLLSLYYLMTVRFGVKRQVFARKYEPYMHALTLAYFLSTAIAGLIIGLYSELEITQGCWIGEYPADCEASGTCRGTTIGWIFAGVPFVVVYLGLPVSNVVIFMFVRRKLGVADPTTGEQRVRRTQREEDQRLRVKEVAVQGLMYVIFFYVAYTPAFIVRVLEGLGLNGEAEEDIFPVLLLNSLLLPLQGIFNVFIYSRPNYVRVRNAFPEQTRLWSWRHCMLESEIPTLTAPSRNLYSSQNSAGKRSINGPPQEQSSSSRGRKRGSSADSLSKYSGDLEIVHEDSREDQESDTFSSSFRKPKRQPTSSLKSPEPTPKESNGSLELPKQGQFALEDPIASADSLESMSSPYPSISQRNRQTGPPVSAMKRPGPTPCTQPVGSLDSSKKGEAICHDSISSQGSKRVNMDGTIT